MASPRERLGPSRADVLGHLRSVGDSVSVTDVAEAVGLHPNTTRFHLDALASAGLVSRESESRSKPGRPRVLYSAVGGPPADPYKDLARAMVRQFARSEGGAEGQALEAGRSWGADLRASMTDARPDQPPLERLVDAMAGLGYEPQLVVGPGVVGPGAGGPGVGAPTAGAGDPGRGESLAWDEADWGEGQAPQGEARLPLLELRPCPFAPLALANPGVVCQLHLGLTEGLLGPDQPWQATEIRPWVTETTCQVSLMRRPQAEASGSS